MDPHKEIAKELFNTKNPTAEQRRLAKTATFTARYSSPSKDYIAFPDVRHLFERRRRARHNQRIAIALLVISAILILVLEAYRAH